VNLFIVYHTNVCAMLATALSESFLVLPKSIDSISCLRENSTLAKVARPHLLSQRFSHVCRSMSGLRSAKARGTRWS
jgi:hypothetical protein